MKRLIIILLSVLPMLAVGQEQDTVVAWQDNDSVVMAPLKVQPVGVDNYESLSL